MNLYGWENCPEPNKEQIMMLKGKLIEYLGTNLAGIYVHGSLALDSFNPDSSDIDVIVLLHEGIGTDLKYELVKLFLDLSNQPSPIEISLIAMDAVHPWKHPTPFELHSSEYWRERYEEQVRLENKAFWEGTPTDSDLACHITLIHHKGICIHGLPIEQAFPPVPEKDFRSSLLSDIQYAADAVHTLPVYGILTLCRVLSYLETGDILSKAQAGEWALPLMPDNLRYIVAWAVDRYTGIIEENMQFDESDLVQYRNLILSRIDGHL